jgi:hypothetical protein
VSTADQAPVSVHALIQRINRKLAHEGERIKTCRNERWRGELGTYYVVHLNHKFVVQKRVDLEGLGRALRVLAPDETVAADD